MDLEFWMAATPQERLRGVTQLIDEMRILQGERGPVGHSLSLFPRGGSRVESPTSPVHITLIAGGDDMEPCVKVLNEREPGATRGGDRPARADREPARRRATPGGSRRLAVSGVRLSPRVDELRVELARLMARIDFQPTRLAPAPWNTSRGPRIHAMRKTVT